MAAKGMTFAQFVGRLKALGVKDDSVLVYVDVCVLEAEEVFVNLQADGGYVVVDTPPEPRHG